MYLWTIPNGKAAERVGRVDDIVDSLRRYGTLPYIEAPLGAHDWVFTYMIPRAPPLRVSIDKLFTGDGSRVVDRRAFLRTGAKMQADNEVLDPELRDLGRAYPLTSGELTPADFIITPYAHEVTSGIYGERLDGAGTGLFIALLSPIGPVGPPNERYRLFANNHSFKNRILSDTLQAVLGDLRPIEFLANTYGHWMRDPSLRRKIVRTGTTVHS